MELSLMQLRERLLRKDKDKDKWKEEIKDKFNWLKLKLISKNRMKQDFSHFFQSLNKNSDK